MVKGKATDTIPERCGKNELCNMKRRIDSNGQPFALTEDFESEIRLLATGFLVIEAVDAHIDFL